jgi:hypothetical protein
MKEKMKEESKRKLLSFVYYNIHPMKFIVSKSFDDFKKENLYFLDGLTQKQIKMELTLNKKLSLIQKEFKASKSKFNSFGKYNFRSAEDILEALKPFNEKYGVYFTVVESLSNIGDLPIIKTRATIHDIDGVQEIDATAIVGVDLAQKGMQIPQAFGSASSYGKKYALGNLLLIDDTQDADATNTHGKESKPEVKEKELSWLNKNTPEFTQAIEYLKKGGKLAAIETKYKLSKSVKDELLKIK